jgi:hypothetical protein
VTVRKDPTAVSAVFWMLTANKEAVAVFPTPGVPVMRTLGRRLVGTSVATSLMVDQFLSRRRGGPRTTAGQIYLNGGN